MSDENGNTGSEDYLDPEAVKDLWPTPSHFAKQQAEGSAELQTKYGYNADFTLSSLADVDRLIDEHICDGEPVPGSYFDPPNPSVPNISVVRLSMLGFYAGEVFVRHFGGQWHTDTKNARQWIPTLRVVVPTHGLTINVVGKVTKRAYDGEGESVMALAMSTMIMTGIGPPGQTESSSAPDAAPSLPKVKKPKPKKGTSRKRPSN